MPHPIAHRHDEQYLRDAESRFVFDPDAGIYTPKTYYENKQRKKRSLSAFEWGNLILNAFTLIVLALYTHYSRQQWVEMKKATQATPSHSADDATFQESR